MLSFHHHNRGNTSSLFAFWSLLVLAGDAASDEQVAYLWFGNTIASKFPFPV
jgi:hypothetical protein